MAKKWNKLPADIWNLPAADFEEMLDHWQVEAYHTSGGE